MTATKVKPKKTSTATRSSSKRAAPVEVPATDSTRLDKIAAETLLIPIVGTSPLLMHKFSEKSKRQMLDSMQGKKAVKEKKDPEQEYLDAFYRLKNGQPGFPAIAFKAATIGASRFYDSSVTMVGLRQCLFFTGETGEDGQQLVAIEGDAEMREDVVRVGRGGADLRYRPQFTSWKALLKVTYVKSMLDRNSVLSLIDAGGLGVGVGEWRPERNGDFGCYTIDPKRKVEVLSI